ncbi:PrgH/EprH family type III secretion apparatus protein, partial [Pseudomonas fluorescens]
FNQQWGERYVHFAIELKDDWLKGKSFQYGPQGYVKMTPSSWYFPKPL